MIKIQKNPPLLSSSSPGILSVVFGNIRLRMGAGKNEREISSWALHPVTPRVGQEVWAEMGWPEGQRETAPPGKCLCPSAQAWPHVNRAGNSQMGPLLSHHPMVAVTILLESLLVSSRSSVGCFFISWSQHPCCCQITGNLSVVMKWQMFAVTPHLKIRDITSASKGMLP